MAEASTIRVATIGAGYFSAFHVAGWIENPDARFEALCDLDAAKAATLLAGLKPAAEGVRVFTDAGAMLREVQPDILDIASQPATHADLIQLALSHGVKTIVCQKPFCGTLAEARRATALAAEAGALLVVHENFRFQPWYRVIRDEIASGRVGELYQVSFRLRPGDGQGADAYLSRQPYFQKMPRFLVHETAVHWIDTFRFLFGEPEAVWADLRRLNAHIAGEDSGLIVFRYGDGRRALFDGNRLVDHPADNTRLTMGECLVEGSAGVLTLDGYGAVRFRARGSTEWQGIPVDIRQGEFGGGCVFALEKHVTDHLLHGTPIENDAPSYLRNQRIEEAVYSSAETGCTVTLELDAP